MLCTACNKESKNLRVCPYCFTPYPTDGSPSAKRTSTSRGAVGPGGASGSQPSGTSGGAAGTALGGVLAGLRENAERLWAWYRRQSPTVRYASAGILLVALLWWSSSGEPEFEAGTVPSDIIATPMQREEALALVKQTRESAIVDVQQDEVFVSYAAATFPVREEGQVALAQQFARADEIVEGRKRRIYFYNPNGKLFAQSDGVRGVQVVR